jgi:hypothetical protein
MARIVRATVNESEFPRGASDDPFPVRLDFPAEVAQTAGLKSLLFVQAVASPSALGGRRQLAPVNSTAGCK